VFGQFGTRANKAHITAQDVEELRYLVEFESTKERADRRKDLIADCRDCASSAYRHMAHGSEFEDSEGASISTHALLEEKHRTAGSTADGKPNKEEDRY
jgi:hypothetical protein